MVHFNENSVLGISDEDGCDSNYRVKANDAIVLCPNRVASL